KVAKPTSESCRSDAGAFCGDPPREEDERPGREQGRLRELELLEELRGGEEDGKQEEEAEHHRSDRRALKPLRTSDLSGRAGPGALWSMGHGSASMRCTL